MYRWIFIWLEGTRVKRVSLHKSKLNYINYGKLLPKEKGEHIEIWDGKGRFGLVWDSRDYEYSQWRKGK